VSVRTLLKALESEVEVVQRLAHQRDLNVLPAVDKYGSADIGSRRPFLDDRVDVGGRFVLISWLLVNMLAALCPHIRIRAYELRRAITISMQRAFKPREGARDV
jgi:hypothetical protein